MTEAYQNYDFVEDEESAKKRFEEFASKDPLPDIPPALLNSGDICDYARITGMVYPFNKQDKLKPASYEIDFLGDVYQKNETTGEVEKETIEHDTPFTLKKNSIAFLFTKTKFFLPDYIAIRFNLGITLVHRGLLLGTGPLVDPGFVGNLLIPLHNLTSEDYVIKGGEGIIWVEFTKLSPHTDWSESSSIFRTRASYKKFPSDKRNLSAQKYFNKASPTGEPSKSSIPSEIRIAQNVANEAKNKVSDFYVKARNWTLGGTIALIIGVMTLVYASWDLISNANQHVAAARDTVAHFKEEQFQLILKLQSLEDQVRYMTERLRSTEQESRESKKNQIEVQKNDSNESSH